MTLQVTSEGETSGRSRDWPVDDERVVASLRAALGGSPDDLTPARAALLALHELRAGREPVVAMPGRATAALRFPSDESLSFAGFTAGAAAEPLTASCRLAIGDPDSAFAIGWRQGALRATSARDASEAERMAQRLAHVVAQLERGPDAPVEALDWLPPAERAVVVSHTEGELIDLDGTHVLGEFIARAKEAPERPAVIEGDRVVTYGELAARARSYAKAFASRGVNPGGFVAIAVPRSIECVAAILGAFWIGAAYVPMDPEYPAARLELMAADADASVIIADKEFAWARALGTQLGPREITDAGDDWRDAAPVFGDIAYMIYTSGSTGRPKGVRVRHRGLAKDLRALERVTALTRDDVFLAIYSHAFDVSLSELVFPLAIGARTHVIPHADVLDGERMRAHFERVRPTVTPLPRPVWEALLAAGYAGDGRFRAWTGGEQMPGDLARRVSAMIGSLFNCYGPTETTITATVHRCLPTDEAPIPIGKPLANVQTYVLDGRDRLQPIGFAGELVIAGEGLAEGYHRMPELTAERYPTLDVGGVARRVYRTGDVVRLRDDGELEFVGRRDEQVKVRGYRVELGEIAAALRAIPGVRDALTLVHDDALCAYVIVDDASVAASDFASLRAAIAKRLPRFMLPSYYFAVDGWSATINGKIDRDRLPRPPRVDDEAASPARSEPELDRIFMDALKTIARTALALPELNEDDDFRDLGATSLSLVRLASALRKRGMAISVADLYAHPTLTQIASLARSKGFSGDLSVGASPAAPSAAVTSQQGAPVAATTSSSQVARSPSIPPPAGDSALLAVVERVNAPLVVRAPVATYSWEMTKSIVFPLIFAILNHPYAPGINAVRFSFRKTPDLDRLRAAWASIVEDVPVLRARLDLSDEPKVVVEQQVTARFAVVDVSDLPQTGYEWRVGHTERARKGRGLVVEDAPYHALDIIIGPGGECTVIFSHPGFLIDLETLDGIVGELWRRYERGIPDGSTRPRAALPSPFGDPPVDDASATAMWQEMFAGLTRPTRIPFDAVSMTADGVVANLGRMRRYGRTTRLLATSPEIRRLLNLSSKGDPPPRRPADIINAIMVHTSGKPSKETRYFGADLRRSVQARAAALKVTEHAVFLTALGLLVRRWAGLDDALVRVLVANRGDVGAEVAGRRTSDVLLRFDMRRERTVGELISATHATITRVLEHQGGSRSAFLRALPFGEPVTHVTYIAGEGPSPGEVPAVLELSGFHCEESIDGVLAIALAWKEGDITFHFDASLLSPTTVRRRLREFVQLVERVATTPMDSPISRLSV